MTSVTQVCCELEMAKSTPSSRADGRSGALLAASCCGCCLVFVSGAVVSVALAAIGRDLALGSDQLQWIINAELLPLAAFTLLGGALGDRYGHRRMFLIGIALFGAASVACAVSVDWAQLVCGRFFQGVVPVALPQNHSPDPLAVNRAAHNAKEISQPGGEHERGGETECYEVRVATTAHIEIHHQRRNDRARHQIDDVPSRLALIE